MNRVIPILPCPSIREQTAFYENLGFRTIQTTTRPNPYAVVGYGTIELHFYGSKRTPPQENATMCYVQVDDVAAVYEAFASHLKAATGKIPRTGIPRISKLKELSEDLRFLLTDPGGNTLFIGTPKEKNDSPSFFRTIESADYAHSFAILYDLMYSKEDIQAAHRMLVKFFPEDPTALKAADCDLAKIWLVALDIMLQQDPPAARKIEDKLTELFGAVDLEEGDWSKLVGQYRDIVGGE